MNQKLFLIALRAFTKRKPFRPFEIQFHSGDGQKVTHPEAVSLHEAENSHDYLFIHHGPDGKHRVFESSSVNHLLDMKD